MPKTTLQHKTATYTATRTTHRNYTHVVVGTDETTANPFVDHVISWHGSEAAAVKAARSYRWATDLRIEPINGGVDR